MDEASKQAVIAHILKVHKGLRERALPTIVTMRTENGKNNIFMTDLTEQGKNEVVSLPDWLTGKERKGKYSETEHMVEIANIHEISESLAIIFEQSIATGCKFNFADVFFLVVDKESKRGKVLLGDLAEIEFVDVGDITERETLADHNYQTILHFVREMRSHLQGEERFSMNPILAKKKEFSAMFKSIKSSNV
ncbi:hypothetical protein HQ487_02555 [Candidatus Uhrbacteria bacterium]|nr:hypothetical protein [Candidatus Uhrbacteria bacterium]